MLGTSTTELIFIRLCITGLRAIAPVSILYSGYAALRTFGVVPVLDAAPVAVEMGLFLEAAWWLLVYVPRRCWLQRVRPMRNRVPRSSQSRWSASMGFTSRA